MRRLLGLTGVVMVLALASPAAAFDPASFEARAEYLLRQMDAGVMPTPTLIAMLGDPYPETRVMALRVAASSADPNHRLLLQEVVQDRDFRVRYETMIAAGRLGEAGRNVALRGLRDDVPKVRQAAAWAATHGGPDALGPLVAILAEEPDVGVRATALANLWRFDVADWVRHAAAAATEPDAQLRRAAAYSLARSDRPDVRPALRRLAGDPEAVIRATAVAGLGRAALGEDDLAVLVRALADGDSRVRAAACGALARQPTPELPKDAAAAVAAMWTPLEAQLSCRWRRGRSRGWRPRR